MYEAMVSKPRTLAESIHIALDEMLKALERQCVPSGGLACQCAHPADLVSPRGDGRGRSRTLSKAVLALIESVTSATTASPSAAYKKVRTSALLARRGSS